MMVLRLICVIVLAVGLSTGCKAQAKAKPKTVQKPEPAAMPADKAIDSPELAVLILKPVAQPLSVNRDPFKPLLEKDQVTMQGAGKDNAPKGEGLDNLDDVALLGVIKVEDEFKAYMKIKDKLIMYKLNDRIRDYTITLIDRSKVVLRSETNEVVKKRGDNT